MCIRITKNRFNFLFVLLDYLAIVAAEQSAVFCAIFSLTQQNCTFPG